MMISDIDGQIEKLRSEIAKLEKQKEELKTIPPEARLAEELHRLLCQWNHTDGCGWYYENGSDRWARSAHLEYLKRAHKIMRELPEYSIEEIMRVVRAIYGKS